MKEWREWGLILIVVAVLGYAGYAAYRSPTVRAFLFPSKEREPEVVREIYVPQLTNSELLAMAEFVETLCAAGRCPDVTSIKQGPRTGDILIALRPNDISDLPPPDQEQIVLGFFTEVALYVHRNHFGIPGVEVYFIREADAFWIDDSGRMHGTTAMAYWAVVRIEMVIVAAAVEMNAPPQAMLAASMSDRQLPFSIVPLTDLDLVDAANYRPPDSAEVPTEK